MKVGYVRVSTTQQNTARQLDGIMLDKTFEEKQSAKTADRPQLQACLAYCREGDTLFVHSIDRIARNLVDLRKIVEGLNEKSVEIHFVKENLTFGGQENSMGKLMLNIMGSFAEFELALNRERTMEGVAKAKAAGKYKGRVPALNTEQAKQMKTRLQQGVSKAKVAREFGISRETVYNYI